VEYTKLKPAKSVLTAVAPPKSKLPNSPARSQPETLLPCVTKLPIPPVVMLQVGQSTTGVVEDTHGVMTMLLSGTDELCSSCPPWTDQPGGRFFGVPVSPPETTPARVAPEKLAPSRLALVSVALVKTAPVKLALVSSAPARFAPVRSAPETCTPLRFAPIRSAPVRLAPRVTRERDSLRSGSRR